MKREMLTLLKIISELQTTIVYAYHGVKVFIRRISDANEMIFRRDFLCSHTHTLSHRNTFAEIIEIIIVV